MGPRVIIEDDRYVILNLNFKENFEMFNFSSPTMPPDLKIWDSPPPKTQSELFQWGLTRLWHSSDVRKPHFHTNAQDDS